MWIFKSSHHAPRFAIGTTAIVFQLFKCFCCFKNRLSVKLLAGQKSRFWWKFSYPENHREIINFCLIGQIKKISQNSLQHIPKSFNFPHERQWKIVSTNRQNHDNDRRFVIATWIKHHNVRDKLKAPFDDIFAALIFWRA